MEHYQTFSHLTASSDQARINSLVTIFRERYSSVGYSENKLYDGIETAPLGHPLTVGNRKIFVKARGQESFLLIRRGYEDRYVL